MLRTYYLATRFPLRASAVLFIVAYSLSAALSDDNLHSAAIRSNNEGVALMSKSDYKNAVKAFSKAVLLNSQYALALVNRGLAKEKLRDYDGAIADFTQAMKHKASYGALVQRARLELSIDDFQAAEADYTELIKRYRQPQCKAEYYHARAIARRKLGDAAGACSDLKQENIFRSKPPTE